MSGVQTGFRPPPRVRGRLRHVWEGAQGAHATGPVQRPPAPARPAMANAPDTVVSATYGWAADIPDDEVLRVLRRSTAVCRGQDHDARMRPRYGAVRGRLRTCRRLQAQGAESTERSVKTIHGRSPPMQDVRIPGASRVATVRAGRVSR